MLHNSFARWAGLIAVIFAACSNPSHTAYNPAPTPGNGWSLPQPGARYSYVRADYDTTTQQYNPNGRYPKGRTDTLLLDWITTLDGKSNVERFINISDRSDPNSMFYIAADPNGDLWRG